MTTCLRELLHLYHQTTRCLLWLGIWCVCLSCCLTETETDHFPYCIAYAYVCFCSLTGRSQDRLDSGVLQGGPTSLTRGSGDLQVSPSLDQGTGDSQGSPSLLPDRPPSEEGEEEPEIGRGLYQSVCVFLSIQFPFCLTDCLVQCLIVPGRCT